MASESSDRAGSWMSRLIRWITTNPAKRYSPPGLVAYHWTNGSPKACPVGNISASGMYLLNDEHWLPGSVIPMTLQLASGVEEERPDWIAVLTQVVRAGPDGHGLAFSFSGSPIVLGDAIPPERLANNRALKRFIKHLNRST